MKELQYLDKETPVFLIGSDQIEQRFDPYYYNSALKDFINPDNFQVMKIREVIVSSKTGFGVGKQDQSNKKDGIIQIRPTNINKEGKLIFDKNVFIPPSLIKSESYLLEKGDVLFNNTNSQEWVGKTAYFDLDKKLAFSNHITVLKADRSCIEPKYLWAILNLYQEKKIFFSICTNWNNQSGIGLDVIKSLKIPVPTLSYQRKIISILNKAYETKAQKEAKAEELLNSIDDYLLSELGIELPEKDNRLEKRMFTTSFQSIAGSRLDPSFNSYSFSLESPDYPNIKFLKHIDLDPSWEKKRDPEMKASFVPMDSVNDKFGHIESKENRLVKKSAGYTRFREGDILWAKITPCMQNGKSAIASDLKNELGFGSTEFFVLRCNNLINSKYILSLLRLKALRESAKKYFGGASGHQRVSPRFFKDLKMPLPKRKIQDQIANEIEKRKSKALKLKKEARQAVENARQKVEEMILAK